MRWTREQAAAIVATPHTMLVANAGTGKTSTVVGKILWLLGENVGVDQDGAAIPVCENPCALAEIAAVTFTEKAAYDLKRKLREQLAKSPRSSELLKQIDRAALGTIHSFCGQLLRENALRLGIDPGFSILAEDEAKLRQSTIIRDIIIERITAGDEDLAELYREMGLYGSDFKTGTIDYVRSAMRDVRWHTKGYREWCADGELDAATVMRLADVAADAKDDKVIARCRALYRLALLGTQAWHRYERAENVRDYDSLILTTRDILSSAAGEPALRGIQRRYRILVIDEFQDTDGAQRDIAYAIARAVSRPQLFLVGDPKQSIYRFRGADISVWNSVANDLRSIAEPLPLTSNFRSDPVIVGAVNAAAGGAIEETAQAVAPIWPQEDIHYADLVAERKAEGTGAVEWLEPASNNADDARRDEGRHIASRIQSLVGKQQIIDPETSKPRICGYKDIAVLYRARTGVELYKTELRLANIPLHDRAPVGLTDRQEIHDVLNYLRFLYNPSDDLRAFAFLRSPFVGLRDEVIARIRLFASDFSLLSQAHKYLKEGEWFAAAEHDAIVEIERAALRAGLDLFEEARALADRVPIDELLTFVLARSGYRDHLLLLEGNRETLANLRAFVQLCEQHRDLLVGAFLQLWDQRDPDDPGVPQGQIFSAKDDVVTFSTIHAAKGLEWPVVFLAGVGTKLDDRSANQYWSDAMLGPVLCPSRAEIGPRADKLRVRRAAHELAEDARVLYVALTRARDRLIITGQAKPQSFGAWLAAVQANGVTPVTSIAPYQVVEAHRIELSWLTSVATADIGPLSRERPAPPHRFLTSATELMTRENDPQEWERKYINGIEAEWFFASTVRQGGEAERALKVPASLHGTIVHGVLERIREEAELAEILEQTIGELDAPELEGAFAAGSEYRAALEEEILRVIRSDEWKWYVEGEHYRELSFVHLVGAREWRIGAFDLYRPDSPDAWIIDFKTHQIVAEKVAKVAEDYRIQAEIYKAAVRALKGSARMRLHFTHPGVAVEV